MMRGTSIPRHHACRGFSLIELMVALGLSALMLTGTVVLFQQSRSSGHQDEQTARMQENGRYALRLLTRELMMSGYWAGMVDVSDITTADASIGTDCASGWAKTLSRSLEFTNNASASPYTACVSNAEVSSGTDVIALRRVADLPVMRVSSAGVRSGSGTAGTIYLKTNLVKGALYDADSSTDVGPTSISTPNQVLAYLPQVFYVRPWSSTSGDGIPTLVREGLEQDDMAAQPLVDGVENMQFEFGIDGSDEDVSPDYYTSTPTVSELSNAVSARVSVLIRSINPVTGYVNDKTYTVGPQVINPRNDAYYRRVYSGTVQLRNADKLKLYAVN